MKTIHPFFTFVVLLLFISCKKEKIEAKQEQSLSSPQEKLKLVTDTCSYTIDGIRFSYKYLNSFGKGTQEADIDLQTGKGHPDSSMFSIKFGFNSELGFFEIRFMKKYGKNQLSIGKSNVLVPENEMELFTLGEYPYALDFERFSSQDGIAISTLNRINNISYNGKSYQPSWRNFPTSIGHDAQKDSYFEITSLDTLSDGRIVMEAKFNVNIFDVNEKIKKVKDGFLRLHVNRDLP